MAFFVEGTVFGLIMFAIIVILALLTLQKAKQGYVREVRTLPGIEGIREAIARCAEMGRPCFLTTGHGGGGLYTSRGPQHMAGIAILSLVARLTAKLGVDLVTTWPFPELLPVAEDTIYQAYLMEGKPEEVRTDMVRYIAGYALAFKMGYIGQLTRENAGAAIVTGAIWPSDALQMTEPGVLIGAIQIGGAPTMDTMSMLALTCDYTFIGEELFSAGAFASEDPIQLGVLFSSDIVKIGLILLMIVGVLLTTMGTNISPIFDI